MRAALSLTIALVMVLTFATPVAASDSPPDQVDPPAPGEGQPLDDPSDGPYQGYAMHAAPRVSLSGPSFAPQSLLRLKGSNRFQTAVLASRYGWPDGAPAAVLASGETHTDALAGATLAGVLGGPLLLTPTDRLDSDTASELTRLDPATVYVIGGVSGAVSEALTEAGFEVERVGSNDAHGTSFAAAVRAIELGADPTVVLVASAGDFADALAAGALAAGLGHPLLLTGPSGLRDWLADRVSELGADRTWVIGGTSTLPDEAVEGLPGLERLAGADRVGTSLVVADRARAHGLTGRPVLVGGHTFADALAGGVLAGHGDGPLLVSSSTDLSLPVAEWLAGNGISEVTVLGGPGSLAGITDCQLRSGESRAWLCAEEELARQGYNTGEVDGRVDHQTAWAILAFQKVARLGVDGHFAEEEWQALVLHPTVPVARPDLPPDHIEIDLARQLILVVRDGEVAHAVHTSTGKPSTPTVRGTFTVYEKRNFRQSWNDMYRPVFFYRGYAIHGYPSVPLYPASHGCARTYDGDMDFLWPMLEMGMRVATY